MKAFFLRLLGIGRNLWDFLSPLFAETLSNSLERILPIALAIVADLATRQDLSSADKFTTAQKTLQEVLIKEGITAGTSLVNLSVELAVQKLRAKNE